MFFFKGIIKIVFIFGGVLCFAKNCLAQDIDTMMGDIDYIRNSNLWINSKNATGLQYVPVEKISKAELGFQKSNGGFKNYSQSDNSYGIGINTESFYRLNRNTVLYGLVDYRQTQGKQMQGSVLIDNYSHPLSFEENADTTFGNKKLELLNLSGGISTAISKRLLLGGKIVYQAADYAKFKDLRHINRLLNLNTDIGATYKMGKGLEVGLNYTYGKRIESVKFEIHGNTDKQYLVFLNYGSFYGRSELFSEGGYTSDKRPLVNNKHELTTQAAVQINADLRLLNEFTVGKRTGYYGKKGSVEIMFTQHEAVNYSYTGTLQLKGDGKLQQLKLNGSFESLDNWEKVYKQENTQGGASSIVYYGQNKLLSQEITDILLAYDAYFGVIRNNPKYFLKAAINYTNRNRLANLFPYYRKQDINSYSINVAANRNIIKANYMVGFLFGIGYGAGNGLVKSDGIYQTPSEDQRPPTSRDAYLYQEYEFLTNPRVTFEPAIQYSRLVNNNTAAYIKLGTQYTKAFDVSYLRDSYNTASLSIGCFF